MTDKTIVRRIAAILAIATAALAAAAAATAADSASSQRVRSAQAAKPTITRVTPMRLRVGALLTIRGRNFKAKPRRNTVVFKGAGGRSAFAKPRRATKRKLVVRVPASVARLLVVEGGRQRPTRIQLRVLAGRFSAFTPRRLSPVVISATGGSGPGGDGPAAGVAVCESDADHDDDLLSNAFELQIKTDPCLRDTDADGIEDGYELQAAIDLNHYPGSTPLPYPDKRPYPNALDPTDASTDYDGDGLRLLEEFMLWRDYSADGVRRPGRPGSLAPLVYSDGLQRSASPPPPVPAEPLYAWVLDQNGDGVLSDGERDADADGLGNWDELRGRFTEAWWPAIHSGDPEPMESRYPSQFGNFLDNEDLPNRDAHANPDTDGDEILDGADDHDHDGLSNQFEIRRPGDWIADAGFSPPGPPANPWAYVNPFNPCKPFRSERCHEFPPIGYYSGDSVPPVGPSTPPGYPDSRPVTPDG